jgi:uncharacterized protein YvpB
MKNKIHRLFPNGFTGDSLENLQKLLDEGWVVKIITTVQTLPDGRIISDYILERQN